MSDGENYLPDIYLRFWEKYPSVSDAFHKMAEHEHAAGPLDERSRRLVKLGIAIGSGSRGAVRSQVRQALRSGLGKDEVSHAILLALSTLGLPATVAAYKWMEQVFEAAGD